MPPLRFAVAAGDEALGENIVARAGIGLHVLRLDFGNTAAVRPVEAAGVGVDVAMLSTKTGIPVTEAERILV